MQTRTFNVSFPDALLAKIDSVARKEYRNRSELIREAVRSYIQDKEDWAQLYKTGGMVKKRMNLSDEKEINALVREYRHGKKAG